MYLLHYQTYPCLARELFINKEADYIADLLFYVFVIIPYVCESLHVFLTLPTISESSTST